MKRKTREWIEFAKRDLMASKELKDNKYLTHISCFHAQQGVEKILKAVLEENDILIPKVHDLIKLNNLVKNVLDIKLEGEHLKKLNEIYAESRYPSDIGFLPSGFPNTEEANEMYNLARGIFENVVTFLEKM